MRATDPRLTLVAQLAKVRPQQKLIYVASERQAEHDARRPDTLPLGECRAVNPSLPGWVVTTPKWEAMHTMTNTGGGDASQALYDAAKDVLLQAIGNTKDRSEQKERIMIAWEEGLLWPNECERLIARFGLKQA